MSRRYRPPRRSRTEPEPPEEPASPTWTEKAKSALQTGGEMVSKGAQAAGEGYSRYIKWMGEKNREAIERSEREKEDMLTRRQRAIERQRATIELAHEERQLELEERRHHLEMMKEEAKLRRELGPRDTPQAAPSGGQGFGYSNYPQTSQRPRPISALGVGGTGSAPAPRSGPGTSYGYGFGVPQPGFRTPREIIEYDGGTGLLSPPKSPRKTPSKSPPRTKPGTKNTPPKKSTPKKKKTTPKKKAKK